MRTFNTLGHDVSSLHDELLLRWLQGEEIVVNSDLYNLISRNHWYNFKIWQFEDIVRLKTISDAEARDAKNNIDYYNQSRNTMVERIDENIYNDILKIEGVRLNSETPGMIIDRLSILSLKIHYSILNQEKRHAEIASYRNELICRLNELMSDVFDGKRSFMPCRSLKLYENPTSPSSK